VESGAGLKWPSVQGLQEPVGGLDRGWFSNRRARRLIQSLESCSKIHINRWGEAIDVTA